MRLSQQSILLEAYLKVVSCIRGLEIGIESLIPAGRRGVSNDPPCSVLNRLWHQLNYFCKTEVF